MIASWLAPSPDEVAPAVAAAPPADRSWSQRQLILDRNLFGATLDSQKAAPAPVSENLEATKLPLTLIGTAATGDPETSWAAVQDTAERQHLVLQQGDSVKGKATVERIERERIVLREYGQLRELALSDEPVAVASQPKRRNTRTARAAGRRASRRSARAPKPPAPEPEENPLASAAQLFSQANIVPKFEDGEMVGMEVNSVQSGSFVEAAGIGDGDVITELNGIRIDSQEQGQRALAEMAGNDTISVKVRGADGSEKDLQVPLNPSQ